MIINVEAGELFARTDDGRVNLIVHADEGNFCLALSPLAANNLGILLPDLAAEAAGATIAGAVAHMQDAADPAAALATLRIPVTDEWPQVPYLACFDGMSAARYGDPVCWPDEAEAEMLASYIGYVRSWYPEAAQQQMMTEPFDTGELATDVFHKHGDGDWTYRCTHWDTTTGPFWAPHHLRPLSLAGLLDHIVTSGGVSQVPRWDAWRHLRPEIFPGRGQEVEQ
jgi:hypothetical protein